MTKTEKRTALSQLWRWGVLVPIYGKKTRDTFRRTKGLQWKYNGIVHRLRAKDPLAPLEPCHLVFADGSARHCNRSRVCPFCWFRFMLVPCWEMITEVRAADVLWTQGFTRAEVATTDLVGLRFLEKVPSWEGRKGNAWFSWVQPRCDADDVRYLSLCERVFTAMPMDEDYWHRVELARSSPYLVRQVASFLPYPAAWLRIGKELMGDYLTVFRNRQAMNRTPLLRLAAV